MEPLEDRRLLTIDYGFAYGFASTIAEDQWASDTAVDAARNVYMTGTYSGTIDFDPGSGVSELTALGSGWSGRDVFIAKYTSAGALVWAKSAGGTNYEQPYGIAVDSQGNVYVAGQFGNNAQFGQFTLHTNYCNAFVTKLDSNGNFLWARAAGGTAPDGAYDVTVDTLGNVYVSGSLNSSPAYFPNESPVSTVSGPGGFLWKLDAAAGATQWARSTGLASAVGVDSAGSVYVGGSFTGTRSFGPTSAGGTQSLTSAGGNDAFLAKYNAGGTLIWAERWGGTSDDAVRRLANDSANNLLVLTNFFDTTQLDPAGYAPPITSIGSEDAAISKLTLDGSLIWAKRVVGTIGVDELSAVTVDSADNVYVGGFSLGAAATVAKLSGGTGDTLWTGFLGGSQSDTRVSGLAVDSQLNLFVAGSFTGTSDFDPGSGTANRTSSGGFDIFLAKYVQAPLVVTTADDEVDPNDGLTSLREAIDYANTPDGADTITFDLGLAGQTITLGGSELQLTDTTTIVGLGAEQLTIDGNNASRVFYIGPGVTADISGLTITRGKGGGYGGGIYNAGTLTVTDCTISKNASTSTGYNYGGGIYNAGTLTVTSCTISDNFTGGIAGFNFGGGIYDDGTLTITNSTLSGNSSWMGGGIYMGSAQTLTVSNCTFSDNSASYGGGGIGTNYGGTMTVSNSTFSRNVSSVDGCGGGILNSFQVNLTVSNCTFLSNFAAYRGGGIATDGPTTVTNSTFSANTGGSGGGGGIWNYSGPVTVTNSTVAGNSASSGGGIQNYGAITLTNTIVAGNTNPGSTSPDIGGSVTANYSLIQDPTGASISGTGYILGVDPLLAPLGNYGGPTQTMPLLPGSPAIDAGSNALAVDAGGNPLTADQRGLARIVGGTVDIGAFESSGFTLVVVSGDGQQARIDTPFDAPLVVAVSSNNINEPVEGGVVTFAAQPVGGAAATFPGGATATIQNGRASVAVQANSVAGTYVVTAAASGAALPAEFTLTNVPNLPSAQQQITLLIEQVQALVGPGLPLNTGEANSLTTKLDGAKSALDQGNVNAGINKLQAFINEVNAKIKSKKLTSAQGQLLIDAANAAITSAQSGASSARAQAFASGESWLNPIDQSLLDALLSAQPRKVR